MVLLSPPLLVEHAQPLLLQVAQPVALIVTALRLSASSAQLDSMEVLLTPH